MTALPLPAAPVEMNPVALYDALNCASMAALFAEGGDTSRAEKSLLEAQLAGSMAFPAGTDEAKALGVILAAVGRVEEMAA